MVDTGNSKLLKPLCYRLIGRASRKMFFQHLMSLLELKLALHITNPVWPIINSDLHLVTVTDKGSQTRSMENTNMPTTFSIIPASCPLKEKRLHKQVEIVQKFTSCWYLGSDRRSPRSSVPSQWTVGSCPAPK